MAVIRDYTDPTTQLPAPGAYHRVVGFHADWLVLPTVYLIVASYASQGARTGGAAPFRVVQKPLLDAVVTALLGSAVFKALIARLYTTVVKTDQDYAGGTDAVDASE